jgi:integrase
MFQILFEKSLLNSNPARQIPNLSEKSGEREVYISYEDFQKMLEGMSGWLRTLVQVAYYTGMRRGEIVGLTLRDLDLSRRIIHLAVEDTKERRRKRVPIHQHILPILGKVINGRSNGTDLLFHDNGAAFTKGCGRRTWEKAARTIGFQSPPRFHDLRHTWKTNARRSGMDPEIRESILGHAGKGKSVSEGYGRIGDQELIKAIENKTFDHGSTEIVVSYKKDKI